MVQPLQQLLRHRKVLLLQGPMGRFFKKLADWLDQHGIEYQKINFNGGDALFFGGPQALAYRGTLDGFSGWLAGHMTAQGFEAVLCFGDCRLYHQSAKQVCQQLGRSFFVFEEGYLRPDYITFEQGGVNAFSPLRHQWPQDKFDLLDRVVPGWRFSVPVRGFVLASNTEEELRRYRPDFRWSDDHGCLLRQDEHGHYVAHLLRVLLGLLH